MNKAIAICDSPRARAIRTIRGWVQEGKLSPGDVLPSEETLCVRLDMARGTVRAALKELTETGVLIARKGCRRVIAAAATPTSATMRRTIVLLSGLKESIHDWHKAPGRLQAIEGGALMAIQRDGYHGLTVHPEGLAAEELANLCLDHPVGVLVPDPFAVQPGAIEMAESFRRSAVPVVLNADGGKAAGFDRVVSDQAAGAHALTRRLLERGGKRILRVWTAEPDYYWLAARNQGVEEALRESGLPVLPPVYMPRLPDNQAGDQAVFHNRVRLIAGFLIEHFVHAATPPDVLMLTSDAEVPPAAAACRLLGIDPETRLVFVGYDNMWQSWPEFAFEPSLPALTVDKCNARIGEAMVELLRQRVSGELPPEPRLVVIEPEILIPKRES